MSYYMTAIGCSFTVSCEHAQEVAVVLRENGFEPVFAADGSICGAAFEYGKLLNQRAAFEGVAHLIEDGYIEMRGERDELWRWVFKDGRCHEVHAVVIWPDPTMPELEVLPQEPAISLTLPDGQTLIACSKGDAEYPGLSIELLHCDGRRESILWAEYDEEHGGPDEHLRLLAWRKDADDPVFAITYATGNIRLN